MMQRQEIMSRAIRWMTMRGWKTKLAKMGDYEQSLLDHSLIELDVLIELFPILAGAHHYGLTHDEQRILTVAVLAHDLGKETDEWQAYIREPRFDRWISHILPDLTKSVVPGLCAELASANMEAPVHQIMSHCAGFHHSRPGRSDGAIMEAMLSGGSDRFLTLASLVKAIDRFCSAGSAAEAMDVGAREIALGNHVAFSRHEVLVRGVSTPFLHRAAQAVFQARGWNPLLYFSNATVYAADPNDDPGKITGDEVQDHLTAELDTAFKKDVTPLMVGSPTGNILPKPELFAFSESRVYLQNAARKIGPKSFSKKNLTAKRKVVESYWKMEGKTGKPTDEQVEETAGLISLAQPEMLVFKFFKAMMDPDKVHAVGNDGADLAGKLYEEKFGAGSWSLLQSTSTLMPAKDMAHTVDCFWSLPGTAVNHPEVQRVSELPDQTRLHILIDLLDGIAQRVYAKIERPSPREKLAEDMARSFIKDLLLPSASHDIRAYAQNQLANYALSKPFAGKESKKGIYFCPICNAPFDSEQGVKASADFVANPQTHTNRGPALGSFGYVMVCTTCYYERLLIQILMGSRPAEILTLLPRLNLGPGRGEQLVREVRQWVEAAKGQMRGDTGTLEYGFSLGFTDQAARQLDNRDPFNLQPEELLSVFSHRFTIDTQKRRQREAIKRLKEEFDESLELLNVACNGSFSTWDAAVEALMENRIEQQDFKTIRREVFRLYETIHLICQTPNLIFIPMSYEVAAGADESEASKGLRRLYVALLLSLVFDASVAIHREGEQVDFQGGAGAAYVPPVPAIRSIVGHGWLPVFDAKKWLSAIGAASRLVWDTGLPARNALYQIVSADPPEWLARRIEETQRKQNRALTAEHLHLIEQLPGFHRTEKEVNL